MTSCVGLSQSLPGFVQLKPVQKKCDGNPDMLRLVYINANTERCNELK